MKMKVDQTGFLLILMESSLESILQNSTPNDYFLKVWIKKIVHCFLFLMLLVNQWTNFNKFRIVEKVLQSTIFPYKFLFKFLRNMKKMKMKKKLYIERSYDFDFYIIQKVIGWKKNDIHILCYYIKYEGLLFSAEM